MKWLKNPSSNMKLALGLLASVFFAAGAKPVKPDIPLIIADELKFDSLGYMGGEE